MRVADLSLDLVRGGSAAAGLAGGVVAAALAERLPRRYGIAREHRPAPRARARRSVVLVVLAGTVGLGLGWIVARHPDVDATRAAVYLATNVVLVSLSLAAAAIDVDHMILPNELTIGGAAFALATSPFRSLGLVGALVGAFAGFAIAYAPFLLYKKLRGRSGMGLGDATLAVNAGAWLGVTGAVFVLLAGAVQSIVAAVAMRALGLRYATPDSVRAEIDALRRRAAAGDEGACAELADDPMAAEAGEGLATTRLPLGPFLVLGAIEYVFAGGAIVDAFFR